MNQNFTEVSIKEIAQLLTGFAFKSKEIRLRRALNVISTLELYYSIRPWQFPYRPETARWHHTLMTGPSRLFLGQ